MSRLDNRSFPRGGYTLIEMLIVVGILAVMATLVGPAMSRSLRRSELRDAAKQVRIELGRARLEAIESGVAWQFRFSPGTGRFEVSPRFGPGESPGQMPVWSDETASLDMGPETVSSGVLMSNEPTERWLVEGVYFGSDVQVVAPPLESLDLGEVGLGSYDPAADAGWAPAIVFHPNGRTSNARLRLSGEDDFYVEVTLRGLTGTAKVGPVLRGTPEFALP